MTTDVAVSVELQQRIEQYLYREARMLDDHEYDEWLALWTDDGTYWVPCNSDDIDPTQAVSIIYDDRARLGKRMERLKSGLAWSQDPTSKTRRLISNVEIESDGDGLTVYANFNLTELRRHKQNIWVGRIIYKLREEDGAFKIALKKVLLILNDEDIPNLVFLV